MVQLRTATDPGDDVDAGTWLYAKVKRWKHHIFLQRK